MLSFLLAAAAQPRQIVVESVEPVPARPWTHSYKASCYGATLEIVQPMRPVGAPVLIRMNGRDVRGDTAQLKRELGMVGAAYRVSFLCSNPRFPKKGITLDWVRGSIHGSPQVHYRVGSATFRDGAIVSQVAEDANAETFWY